MENYKKRNFLLACCFHKLQYLFCFSRQTAQEESSASPCFDELITSECKHEVENDAVDMLQSDFSDSLSWCWQKTLRVTLEFTRLSEQLQMQIYFCNSVEVVLQFGHATDYRLDERCYRYSTWIEDVIGFHSNSIVRFHHLLDPSELSSISSPLQLVSFPISSSQLGQSTHHANKVQLDAESN